MSSNQIFLQDERRKLMKEILDLYDPNNEGFIHSKDTLKILQAMGRTLEEDEANNNNQNNQNQGQGQGQG